MPTNLTLKGVPDEVYERLKQSATVNHRSLNSEIIARLEVKFLPGGLMHRITLPRFERPGTGLQGLSLITPT